MIERRVNGESNFLTLLVLSDEILLRKSLTIESGYRKRFTMVSEISRDTLGNIKRLTSL